MSLSERRELINKESTKLSLTRQCKLLMISRSSIYYTQIGFDQATLKLIHEIDRIFTKYPFFASHRQRAQRQFEAPSAPHLSILTEKAGNHAT